MLRDRIRHIEERREGLSRAAAPFEADPVVLSRCTRPGFLAVVEGNQRVAAVCLGHLRGQQVRPFWAYVAA